MLHWHNFFNMSFHADYQAFFFFPPLFHALQGKTWQKKKDLEEYCKCQMCRVVLLHCNEIWVWIITLSDNSFFPHPAKETLKKTDSAELSEKSEGHCMGVTWEGEWMAFVGAYHLSRVKPWQSPRKISVKSFCSSVVLELQRVYVHWAAFVLCGNWICYLW